MTPRERAINEACRREVAALGPPPQGADSSETLEYLGRLFEGANRILRMDLPPETWRDRFRRWFR